MSTIRVTCATCGRADSLTGEAPHGRTLAQLHGWQIVDGRDVCAGCAGTSPSSGVDILTLDSAPLDNEKSSQ